MQEDKQIMTRFTATEKWDTEWHLSLSSNAQNLLHWITTKGCDIAGFWKLNPKLATFYTNLTHEQVDRALAELLDHDSEGETHVVLHKGWIWVRNFLVEQKNLPLNHQNNCHKGIIKVEADHFQNRFFDCQEYRRPEKKKIDPNCVSRQELRAAPKNWKAIRSECLDSNTNPVLRQDRQICEALANWWDHKMNLGTPLEVPMWQQMQTELVNYSPTVIVQAIAFAIANAKPNLNLVMANQIQESLDKETEVQAHHKKPVIDAPEKWETIFEAIYPNATRPDKFSYLPLSVQRRLKLEAKAPQLTS